MRPRFTPTAAIVLALAVAGCSRPPDPQQLADQTTRAVYSDDLAGTTARFDEALKREVTRETVGELSDKMHVLGDYRGIAPLASDPGKGRYEYTASFAGGTLMIELRLDPDGRIAAYRVAQPGA